MVCFVEFGNLFLRGQVLIYFKGFQFQYPKTLKQKLSLHSLKKLQKALKLYTHQYRGHMVDFKSNKIHDQGMELRFLWYVL